MMDIITFVEKLEVTPYPLNLIKWFIYYPFITIFLCLALPNLFRKWKTINHRNGPPHHRTFVIDMPSEASQKMNSRAVIDGERHYCSHNSVKRQLCQLRVVRSEML